MHNISLEDSGTPRTGTALHGGRGHFIRERPIANIEVRHEGVRHREMTLGTWAEGGLKLGSHPVVGGPFTETT